MDNKVTLSPTGKRILNIVRKRLKRRPGFNLVHGTFKVRIVNEKITCDNGGCIVDLILDGRKQTGYAVNIDRAFENVSKTLKMPIRYFNNLWRGWDDFLYEEGGSSGTYSRDSSIKNTDGYKDGRILAELKYNGKL